MLQGTDRIVVKNDDNKQPNESRKINNSTVIHHKRHESLGKISRQTITGDRCYLERIYNSIQVEYLLANDLL